MRRTLLLLPVVGAEPLAGRSRPLQVLLGAGASPATGEFELRVGDQLAILVVALQPEPPRRAVAVHQLNLVSWPAPAAPGQLFTTCFREDPDTPDAAILAGGRAHFAPYAGELPPPAELYPAGASATSFQMVFPTHVPLLKPGRFSTFVALTLRLGEGPEPELQTFVHDPEMGVAGSYPPDPPAPSKGKTARW